MKASLTSTMKRALSLMTSEWQRADLLGIGPVTIRSLYMRGLVDVAEEDLYKLKGNHLLWCAKRHINVRLNSRPTSASSSLLPL